MGGKRKYSLDESVFEKIDSEEKAYWLGFLLADGNIYINSKRYQNLIQIALAAKDVNHLKKFKKFVKSNSPIRRYFIGNGTNFHKTECGHLQLSSKKMVKDLKILGIVAKKSHTCKLPSVPGKLTKHLIRGVWDGDDSVSFRAVDKKYPNNKVPPHSILWYLQCSRICNELFI